MPLLPAAKSSTGSTVSRSARGERVAASAISRKLRLQGKLWGFALDPLGEKIYYATDVFLGSGSPAIIRTNLDGTGLETIVATADAGQPRQLALDLQNQHIYWTSGKYPDVSIRRAGLDGSNPGVVLDLNGSNAPKGITLDPAGNRMFWTHEYLNSIYYANLDGSGAGSFEAANTFDESCLDLAIHPSEGKIYWVTSGSFGEASKVYKAGFDGSDREVITSLGSKTPLGLKKTALLLPVCKRHFSALSSMQNVSFEI